MGKSQMLIRISLPMPKSQTFNYVATKIIKSQP